MLLKKDALESLLIQNWNLYFNVSWLFQTVTNNILNNTSKFIPCQEKYNTNNKKILISLIKLTKDGMLVWVEFETKLDNSFYVGTNELLISYENQVLESKINGNIQDLSNV